MNKKVRVGIIFGGDSSEHEISCLSAWSVLAHIDENRFDVSPIFIDKKGRWHALDFAKLKPLFNEESPFFRGEFSSEWLDPSWQALDPLFSPALIQQKLDLIFAVMHGAPGENGELAGLFTYLRVPFVGCSVMSSAVCMHKTIAKRLAVSSGVDVAPYIVVRKGERVNPERVVQKLGLSLFIKPAEGGSSVGVSKVSSVEAVEPALKSAFEHSNDVLIESAIVGREIEVAVLEHKGLKAAPLGEIIPGEDFYSYSAKYDSDSPAKTQFVTDLDQGMTDKIQQAAIAVFKALGCEGLARVDFFLTKEGQIIFNEINPIPGFTKISMFPVMCCAMGITYQELITILIEEALKKAGKQTLLPVSI